MMNQNLNHQLGSKEQQRSGIRWTFTRAVAFLLAAPLWMAAISTTQAEVIEGVTYRYPGGTTVNSCCVALDANEAARVGTYGDGLLNNGVIGDQAYLDGGGPRHDGFAGVWPAYQSEGSGATLGRAVYFSQGAFTMEFDLGAVVDLSEVTIDYNTQPAGTFNGPPSVTISDGVNDPIVFTDFPAASNGPTGRGIYQAVTVDISELSGQFISLSFPANGNQWGGFNEVTFSSQAAAVPECSALTAWILISLVMFPAGWAWRRRRIARRTC